MSKFQLLYGFHALTSRLRHHPKSIHALYVDNGRQDPRVREFVALAQEVGVQPR
ncbi:MAG: 23S rRNA (guanosine(2251)-2'-O)-methyltransferase RlmB, partial [Ferrovum sp.]|nr:23S rRNA (guanosine(2251)-2'-O)-methyltransferase RlmB [Ferrovum sp.]